MSKGAPKWLGKGEEKEPLLSSTQKVNEDGYGEATEGKPPLRQHNSMGSFVSRNKEKIPGYGMWKLVSQGGVYPLYVLLALLVVYLFNQLDRYTLPIVTTSIGPDLRYGDKTCQENPHVNTSVQDRDPRNFSSSLCTSNAFQHESVCLGNSSLEYKSYNTTACRWWWSGTGLVYQILAGPVFNNLYPIAGVFTGFLADYGNRKVFLVISLVFWSLATGLTGFAQAFWHLVILRALLAIGAAGCSPFAVSILGDYFPQELRGSALGVYYFGIYIGYSLAFAIGNGIVQVLNWRWVFFISGLAGIVVAPIVLITVREPKRTVAKGTTDAVSKEQKLSFVQRTLLLAMTFVLPGMFVLCLAGGIRNAGGYVWAYNTEIFFEEFYSKDTINRFMSWIPLVGGSIGAVLGGVISDLLVKGRGTLARIWVLVVSQVAAAPFAAGALFLPYPWCFLSLIPSNIIGEMWVGATSAIIVDLVPVKIRTASLGLYFFIITVIGGNFNLLVEPIKEGFSRHYGPITSLRLALLLTFPAVYVIGAVLFLVSYFLMKVDLRLKPRVEKFILSRGRGGGGGGRREEEAPDLEEET